MLSHGIAPARASLWGPDRLIKLRALCGGFRADGRNRWLAAADRAFVVLDGPVFETVAGFVVIRPNGGRIIKIATHSEEHRAALEGVGIGALGLESLTDVFTGHAFESHAASHVICV